MSTKGVRNWAQWLKLFIIGVGLLSKRKPLSVQNGMGVEKHDGEGRSVTAEVCISMSATLILSGRVPRLELVLVFFYLI